MALRLWVLMAMVLGLSCTVNAEEPKKAMTFHKADVGKLPAGWNAQKTGEGIGSLWKVLADDSAPASKGYVLAQVNEDPKAHFNLCIYEDSRFLDGSLKVSFKAVKGKKDQGGGLVWRYQNADNYYIARMNPLEDNYRVYKVVAGKRIQLATTEDNVKVAVGTWHTLLIRQSGKKIECLLDGKKMLEAEDDTITKSGKVGLWTKADAQTHFDNLIITGE